MWRYRASVDITHTPKQQAHIYGLRTDTRSSESQINHFEFSNESYVNETKQQCM